MPVAIDRAEWEWLHGLAAEPPSSRTNFAITWIPRERRKRVQGDVASEIPRASATPPPVCDHPADLLWSGICRAALAYRSSLRREVGHLKPAKSGVLLPAGNGSLLATKKISGCADLKGSFSMLKRHAVTTLLHAELANWCTICADASNERLCGNAPGGEIVGRVSKMRT